MASLSDTILRNYEKGASASTSPPDTTIMVTRDLLMLRLLAMERMMANENIEPIQRVLEQTLLELHSPNAYRHVSERIQGVLFDLFQDMALELLNSPIDKAKLQQHILQAKSVLDEPI